MKTPFWIIVLLILIRTDLYSQEKDWRADLFNFFDNTEFGQSAVKIPQTMAGVRVAPEIGIIWDTVNKVNIGVNLLHEYGSPYAVDNYYPTAYYESNRGPLRFLMGAFPRARAIDNYPRLFFQDSISYYRPNINGIFWEYRKTDNYANVWLDWTGRQSKTLNEQFFIGFSGRYNMGIFYLQNFSAMFHYAGKMDPVVRRTLHDNLMFLSSAGIDLSGKTCFNKLEANAGWAIRLERSRADNSGWIKENGLLVETRVDTNYWAL